MANQSGLGRGLSSLIPSASAESGSGGTDLNELALNLIEPNPDQPRTEIDESGIAELSASIALHGLLQPLLVRPHGDKYEIVAGERRWRASRLAGLEKVPVRIVNLDDTGSLEVALIENLQREDLNALEAAYGYKRLLNEYGLTQEKLAERLSKSRVSITNALRLLDLPEEVQAYLYEGKLSAGHARALLALPDDDLRVKLAEKAVENNLSVRDVESMARLSSGGLLPRSPRPISPKSFKTAARRLRKLLTTNVRVKQTKDKRKIEIEFQDEADLARIYQLLSNDTRPLS
ncbi:MAG: ParB/RepB/Spo0J family partition protein [Coriobacteriia bacterium]|nr:ParB/RepB/Spo0J family partition protein [Coriobacteriia bacterium]